MTMSLDDLRQAINAHAWDASFFEVVRIAELVVAKHPGTRIELVHVPDLKFPVSDIIDCDHDETESVLRIRCSFFGLLGTSTPLASHFTEQVLHHDPDGVLRDLYGVIHHALLESLFSSWRDATLRGALNTHTSSAFTRRIATFVAVDWDSGDAYPGNALGSLSDFQRGQPQTMDAASASACLQRIFPTLPIDVRFGHETFVRFADDEMAMLGECNNMLGGDLVYGAGVADRAATVRIAIGRVPEITLRWLLPNEAGHDAFLAIAPRLFGMDSDIELEVALAADEVPAVVLGESACDLGASTWITSGQGKQVLVRIPLRQGADVIDCTFSEEG